MKVSELMGVSLDYWVANAEELLIEAVRGDNVIIGTTPNRYVFAPTRKWEQGGPIIDRERISLAGQHDDWDAAPHNSQSVYPNWMGLSSPTPLIAAMRAYVTSKFGDTVPDL